MKISKIIELRAKCQRETFIACNKFAKIFKKITNKDVTCTIEDDGYINVFEKKYYDSYPMTIYNNWNDVINKENNPMDLTPEQIRKIYDIAVKSFF
jgi:putative sterol carrier protein